VATERVFLATPTTGAGAPVIASPFQFLVTGEDNVRVTVFSSSVAGAVIIVSGRTVDAAGNVHVFKHAITVPAGGGTIRQLIPLAPGFILNLSIVETVGSFFGGSNYCQVELVRGFTGALEILGVLAAGYVHRQLPIAWPGTPIEPSTAGPGSRRAVAIPDPAAGAEYQFAIPSNVLWRIAGFHVVYVTSAAAPLRRPCLWAGEDGGSAHYRSASPSAQGARLTKRYFWQPGMPLEVEIYEGAVVAGWPLDAKLYGLAQGILRTVTPGLAAGDQYTTASVMVDEWIATV
jgi:hypothetical protein